MAKSVRDIREWRDVDLDVFQNEIVPTGQPVVLRALVKDWPAVEQGLISPTHVCSYIKRFDAKKGQSAIIGAPSIEGRFFYRDDVKGFNFERKRVTISTVLDKLISLIDAPEAPAIAMQAVPVPGALPGFEKENVLLLVDAAVPPRMWLGNKSTVAAHFDNNNNIACVVAGRRRFTLFPPEQVANLYIGPLLNTPGGSPISMVDLRNPDLNRFPRFEQALAACQQADLEPGDAIYIPILWWHAVEALDSFNLQINYWWNDAATAADSPFLSLLSSTLSVSSLPKEQRKLWRDFFDYFVFRLDCDPAAHLPDDIQDALGSLTPENREQLKAWMSQKLRS